jgi:GNAT superfamily N-acetyltransferase
VSISIIIAQSPDEIAMCYPIIAQLRPHLQEQDFLGVVTRLSENAGFRLAYVMDGDAGVDSGVVRAVAGYRVSEWLHTGKYLEIEDLIAGSAERSRGYGGLLFDWLVDQARLEGCRQLRLVSGVKRVDAHRFYLRKGMVHEAQYFSLDL